MKTIQVVGAILHREGLILAAQRAKGRFAGLWEFPGGKIEPGETPERALRRELREELKLEVEIEGLYGTIQYDYPDFHLSMQCFLCRPKSQQLTLTEHTAARWLPVGRLEEVPWLPADVPMIQELKKNDKIIW